MYAKNIRPSAKRDDQIARPRLAQACHGSTRPRDQIPVKVHVRKLFHFTKYLPENLDNTSEDDEERLSTSFRATSQAGHMAKIIC